MSAIKNLSKIHKKQIKTIEKQFQVIKNEWVN